MYRHYMVSALVALWVMAPLRAGDPLEVLARDFWQWRARTQPLTSDDIPRLKRPAGWLPEWSPQSVRARRERLREFERRWRAIDPAGWSRKRRVDYRLLGSALARVQWELDILASWRRNPFFYIDQTLGSIFDLLLKPPPFERERSREILRRFEHIPRTLEAARRNLDQMATPFARLAIEELRLVRGKLDQVVKELGPLLGGVTPQELVQAEDRAARALETFRGWLEERLAGLPGRTPVGRDGYLFFLRQVALVPFTPEELVQMARQEWERAVTFETLERARNRGLPQLSLFSDQAAQMRREAEEEGKIRRFLEQKGILSVPAWLHHYRNLPLPSYLEPLAELGVTDDLTSPERLDQDAVSYIRKPSLDLGYFGLSTARDPRPIIVHEGVPGHYFQLALSWAHPDWIRRHYYDSGANEGIGFYAEEMMLQAGLFEDSPRTREIIYNFMRLRALRVEVDVRLALGDFTIEKAARYLERTVPMDRATSLEEAAFFASTPGQAISYQIGKLQIMRFLSDARLRQGPDFSLRAFHDFLWKNGNVPIALLRYQYLGLRNELDRLARLK